jgi:hypothetical protein
MRAHALLPILFAVALGVGCIVLGIVNFASVSRSEQQIEAKLQRVHTGEVPPETLTVIRKYVNPGRSRSAHIIFASTRQPKVDISATRDFFNSVNLGDSVPGYYFPDGYFIPQNSRPESGVGKWAFLGFGTLMGITTFGLARATARGRARVRAR